MPRTTPRRDTLWLVWREHQVMSRSSQAERLALERRHEVAAVVGEHGGLELPRAGDRELTGAHRARIAGTHPRITVVVRRCCDDVLSPGRPTAPVTTSPEQPGGRSAPASRGGPWTADRDAVRAPGRGQQSVFHGTRATAPVSRSEEGTSCPRCPRRQCHPESTTPRIDPERAVAALTDGEIFDAHVGGKLSVSGTVPLDSVRGLSVAYTPGVAKVSTAIAADPSARRPVHLGVPPGRGGQRRHRGARSRRHRPPRLAARHGGQVGAVQGLRRARLHPAGARHHRRRRDRGDAGAAASRASARSTSRTSAPRGASNSRPSWSTRWTAR